MDSTVVYGLPMDLTVLPDQQTVVECAADIVEEFVRSTSTSTLGLSGGSAPPHINRILAGRSIPWDTTTAWMVDERWVGADHDASNQRMVRETLAEATTVKFIAPDTGLDDPHESAKRYAKALDDDGVGGPTAGAILLGMGPDGHTASLFPGTDALTVSDRMYVANWVEQHDTWRLTATYPLIATADLVLIVATGDNKAAMLAAVAGGADLPVAGVQCRGSVRWIVDEAAAAEL